MAAVAVARCFDQCLERIALAYIALMPQPQHIPQQTQRQRMTAVFAHRLAQFRRTALNPQRLQQLDAIRRRQVLQIVADDGGRVAVTEFMQRNPRGDNAQTARMAGKLAQQLANGLVLEFAAHGRAAVLQRLQPIQHQHVAFAAQQLGEVVALVLLRRKPFAGRSQLGKRMAEKRRGGSLLVFARALRIERPRD